MEGSRFVPYNLDRLLRGEGAEGPPQRRRIGDYTYLFTQITTMNRNFAPRTLQLTEQKFREAAQVERRVNPNVRRDLRLTRYLWSDALRGFRVDFWHTDFQIRNSGWMFRIDNVDEPLLRWTYSSFRQYIERHPSRKYLSYVWWHDDARLTAKIPSKSGIILLGLLKGLLEQKFHLIGQAEPQFQVLRTSPRLSFFEFARLKPGEPGSDRASRPLVSAGKADLAYVPIGRYPRCSRDCCLSEEIWPSLVIESGFFFENKVMHEKVQWWFDASDNMVKMVLLLRFDTCHSLPSKLHIEQWVGNETTLMMERKTFITMGLNHTYVMLPHNYNPSMITVRDLRSPGLQANLVLDGMDISGGYSALDIVLTAADLKRLFCDLWNTRDLWEEAFDSQHHRWERWHLWQHETVQNAPSAGPPTPGHLTSATENGTQTLDTH